MTGVQTCALPIYKSHFPSHPYLGDIQTIDFRPLLNSVDLVVGGFPCQSVSSLRRKFGKSSIYKGQSSLFFHLLRCLRECEPKFFIVENVASMSEIDRKIVNKALQTAPVLLNSNIFTGQHRRRLFWMNFPLRIGPEQFLKAIEHPSRLFVDVLDPLSVVLPYAHSQQYISYLLRPVKTTGRPRITQYKICHDTKEAYSKCIPQGIFKINAMIDRRFTPPLMRRLTLNEVHKLQGFPLGWTSVKEEKSIKSIKPGKPICSGAQYASLGNAVTVPVVTYILVNLFIHTKTI